MNILIVCAHPDDEVLGCGGIIKKLANRGHRVAVYAIGTGEGSRCSASSLIGRIDAYEQSLRTLKAIKAETVLALGKNEYGSATTFPPDNQFDTVPMLSIVKAIEQVIGYTNPEFVFTHSVYDLNIDHRITAQAVLTATRPQPGCTIKQVYSFEVLSSTDYGFNQFGVFTPNHYEDITDTIDAKIEAMKCYTTELKEPPHPRSIEGIKVLAKYRGMHVGVKHAEAFMLIRSIN